MARVRSANWRRSNPNKIKGSDRRWAERNPLKYILRGARCRAKQEGTEFSITEKDLEPLPKICPVFGYELIYRSKIKAMPESASIDRHDNNKGYIPGNVHIVSWRANELKSDGVLEEFKKLVSYLESNPICEEDK